MPRALREIMPALAIARKPPPIKTRNSLVRNSYCCATDLTKDKCSIILRRVNACINDGQKKRNSMGRGKKDGVKSGVMMLRD